MVGVVSAQNIQHGGQRDGTHNGGVFAQGILNPHSIAQGGIRAQTNLIKDCGGHKGIGDDLTVAQAAAQLTGLGFCQHQGGVTAMGRGSESSDGNLVVAIGAAHFFGDIRHQIQVGAERGNQNGVAFHGNFQQVQVLYHVLGADFCTQKLVDLFRLQRQRACFGNIIDDINHAIHHIAGFQQLHQLAGTLHSGNSHHGIQILFELAGRLGTHTQCQRGLTDRSTVEVSGFKDNSGGIVQNFGVFAAHNTGQTDGLAFISNHQHTGLQVAHIAVQRGEGFTFLSFTHNNPTAGNIAIVESMHGLTILQHHIVGNVNNVVDRTHTVGAQTLPQPLGGGGDLNILHHTGSVAVAQLGGRHFHIQHLVHGTNIAALYNRLVVRHLHAESGSGFTGQADDAVAVGTVVGDFEFHHGVVIADNQIDVVANLAILVIENPDTVGIGIGQIVLGQTQLGKGAEHTVGLYAPELALGDMHTADQPGIVQRSGNQIAFMDILCAGDDLHRLFLTHIHLADPHVIGILVANNGNNLTHLDIADLGVHTLVSFHLLAENGQSFYIFFIGNMGKINEFLVEPFSVQLHNGYLLRTDSGTERHCRKSDAGQ